MRNILKICLAVLEKLQFLWKVVFLTYNLSCGVICRIQSTVLVTGVVQLASPY